jgi:hypothetical protein
LPWKVVEERWSGGGREEKVCDGVLFSGRHRRTLEDGGGQRGSGRRPLELQRLAAPSRSGEEGVVFECLIQTIFLTSLELD